MVQGLQHFYLSTLGLSHDGMVEQFAPPVADDKIITYKQLAYDQSANITLYLSTDIITDLFVSFQCNRKQTKCA